LKQLNHKQLKAISKATFSKCSGIGLRHAQENLPYIENTILDLRRQCKGFKSALVISAGPSLHIKDQAKLILKSGYKGAIISADGAMYYCLRNGVIPDFVLTVDPHPVRVIRTFGDPELNDHPEDDYFRRQDLDPALNKNELEHNREILKLVDKYGRKIKMVISTSVTPKITKRCLDAGMRLYWWNPIYDDYKREDSLTRRLYNLNKVPCMSTGGNVGASAWVFAQSVLGIKNIALIGMDLSYHPDTPLYKTQYYNELRELFGDKVENGYIKIYNPYLKKAWYTDPAYFWYRQNFLSLAKKAPDVTYNCTEGGILFGNGIRFIKLMDFLKKFKD